MSETVFVEAVMYGPEGADGFVVLGTGETLPITNWFDVRGEEVASHDEAASCVAGSDGRWLSVNLGEYQPSRLQ